MEEGGVCYTKWSENVKYVYEDKETKGGFSDLDKDNLIYSNSLISVSPAGFVALEK